jgi:uncharacterized protein (TIGR02271 family)
MSLIRLSEDRSLHVAENEPQLQHYGFYNENGDKLGSVKDLIADTDTMKVRFLIVSWHEGLLEHKDLIIPIRDVMLDADAQRVICSDCTVERLNSYPVYKGGLLPDLTKRFTTTFLPQRETDTVDRATEADRPTVADRDLVGEQEPLVGRTDLINEQRLARGGTDISGAGSEARMDVIEEDLQIGKRDVQIGEAVIRKTVTEEQVCEPVELRQEHVEIERRAVNRPTDRAPGSGEMEVHVPLMGQEIVRNKQPFVREEIVLHKVSDVNRQDVCDMVRRETVDTHGLEPTGKTDVGAEPVSKTDIAGDKLDMRPERGAFDELGQPDHLYDEPRDRPVI